ncbi:MAG: hypothetical protein HYU57_01510 [Micavibrio aeruginosavorus]|nr:hypothetical protein [Micavibrio aeruginosavorus]
MSGDEFGMHVRFFVLSLISMAAFFPAALTHAQSVPEKIKVGDAYYTRGEIIADFLGVAFSDTLWNEDAKNIESSGFSSMLSWFSALTDDQRTKMEAEMHKYSPWLAQYIYQPGSLPKQGVVNKWEGDITIGFGWPGYSLARSIPENHEGLLPKASYNSNEKAKEIYPLIETDIKPLLKELQQETGKRLSIVSPDDTQDYTEGYARIRIILAPGIVSARTWKPLMPGDWNPYQYEKYLWGGVLFESSDKHMDAYLLPSPDNRIGTVICKIRLGLGMDGYSFGRKHDSL